MNDRLDSPPSADADGATEMNEVSREFNRSLSLSKKDAPTANGVGKEDESAKTLESNDVDADAKDMAPSSSGPPEDAGATNEPESKSKRNFIAPKDFELLNVIGMGAFGKVLQVRNRYSSKIFAMKVISKRLIERKGSYVENILAERNILSRIANHPFIVTMHASFQTKEKLFIIMDLMSGGELFLKLGREGIFRERTAAFYLAEITLALEHLHSINVLHRDLKPENILLGSDGHCCLTDFGLAKDFTGSGDDEDGRARTLCGTMEYMAPEMVARKWYGKGADFWSLGCIAYEMLSGLPPFSSKKGSKELFKKIMNERIRMPDGASAAACKLLKGLLNRDAGKRLGAARGTILELGGVGALKQQAFFSGLNWGKLELKEIEPPEDFSVDHDADLKHFHEEFVNMTLPRSVKEMSKLDFLPKRCASNNFRGFSFIGEDFPLPDRTASEQDHYWNNVDEDGQSLSECASSVFDDDLGDFFTPEPVPEKKKRPPRKKKKKQQQVPLETTDENETNENAVTGKGKKSDGKQELAVKTQEEKESAQPLNGGEPDVVHHDPKQPANPIGKESKVVQKIKPPQAIAGNAPTKSLNPNAHVWSITPATKPAPQASLTKPVTTPQIAHIKRKPVATPSYKPKPGTWASLAVGKAKSNNIQPAAPRPTPSKHSFSSAPIQNGPTKTTVAIPLVSPKTPSKSPVRYGQPSPDWRSHAISPRRSATKQNLVPPLPLSQPPQNAWPSLGDFPPPPGAKPNEQKAKPKGQKQSMGAW
eukprot:CAMPEP_0172533474 /NCGR_PEP_ID=MMETSP1067-20121228/6165_1 /TAXON_ID=265564 ORGANISM="Thalassiosira punctigera, Strain Tpunct2005C2" /NCGR_SAMPLE_ID=MMETSP1067 /ASSEMBLY_ACC=CAM_ASM_000444 /LENGTH=762 /DNA_ID=CAMNT_0013318121 /DNA_START=225 /DNA_END=2510 /DNA_ORIENTATION=+